MYFCFIYSYAVNECYSNVSTVGFAFSRENLHIIRELGHGEFGKVLLAKANGLLQGGDTLTVAVKTLKGTFFSSFLFLKRAEDHNGFIKFKKLFYAQTP